MRATINQPASSSSESPDLQNDPHYKRGQSIGNALIALVIALGIGLAVRSIIRGSAAERDPAQLAKSSARASYLLTLIAMALIAVTKGGSPGVRLAVGLGGLGLTLVAIGAGIYALTCVRKYGSRGILFPALVGLGINSLLIAAAVWGFVDR